MKKGCLLILLFLTTLSCTLSSAGGPTASATQSTTVSRTLTSVSSADTSTPFAPTETLLPALTDTPFPTETITVTLLPTVESLKAKVAADLLSCRYGPGAEYLYLYALKAGANIKLIGRTDANNWVWVDGKNKCWVNAKFLDIEGDKMSLPIVYPGIAKLPRSPYYPASAWAKVTRKGNSVQVTWEPVPISPGKYEDANMHQYIVEVWRCENGQIVFETLGTNFPFITVENDEAGCSVPSHGNVWVQEKHGFAGPTEIPWPPHPTP
jgi:uncharacterized protein YraI